MPCDLASELSLVKNLGCLVSARVRFAGYRVVGVAFIWTAATRTAGIGTDRFPLSSRYEPWSPTGGQPGTWDQIANPAQRGRSTDEEPRRLDGTEHRQDPS